MAAKWIKEIPREELVDGEAYIIAKKDAFGGHYFLGTDKRGRHGWYEKPGLAIHAICNDRFRSIFAANQDHVALEIPGDFAKRWRAR